MAAKTQGKHTSMQILDVAQKLVQTRGFNAFSYADIAKVLGVTTASLHYHFASKADLGVKLIERYESAFGVALARIDRDASDAPARLSRYFGLYAQVLADERMCLCGMLAAEFVTLPKPMQAALDSFFGLNERWLVGLLEQGRAKGELRFNGAARESAQFIIASLEGAMMMARSHGGLPRFDAATRHLLAEFVY